ncbi:MAG: 4Fe-4S dicluster domain-containing protein [Nitrospirota bacterium]
MSQAALALEKLMFVDTSKCIGCKACQVACKQWHQLSAETTTFTGSYQNPALSGNTYTSVKFTEAPGEGMTSGLKWLFFKDQCRHCFRPKCAHVCSTGVTRTQEGFVLFNSNATPSKLKLRRGMTTMTDACPYGVPQLNSVTNTYVKCDFCYDRFIGNPTAKTACEQACPVNAIKTGSYAEIYSNQNSISRQAYRLAKKTNPLVRLYMGKGRGRTNVIYLLTDTPQAYGL